MYSARLIHLLMVAVSIMTVSQAAWFDLRIMGRSWNTLAARQNSSETPSSTPAPASSTPRTTTPAPTTPTTPTVAPSTTPPPAPTTRPTTTTPPVNVPSSSTPATLPPAASSTPPTTTPPPASSTPATSEGAKTTITSTTVLTWETIDSSGKKTTMSSASVILSTAPLSQETGGSSSPGMSDGTRSTIIGVCVGLGGAIVLAVAGVLFWRLRNKKRQQEDSEDLTAGTSQFNQGPEKSEHSGSVGGRSPFQSTLESYHAPSQTNAASNF